MDEDLSWLRDLPALPDEAATTTSAIDLEPTPQGPRVETDPNGRDAHSPGAKLDAGKTRVSLVLGGFARALEEVAKVGTYGANKYTANGWMSVPNGVERYSDALGRHQLREWQGERCDPDTELRHAAHLAWNALARLELMLREEAAAKEAAERAEFLSLLGSPSPSPSSEPPVGDGPEDPADTTWMVDYWESRA